MDVLNVLQDSLIAFGNNINLYNHKQIDDAEFIIRESSIGNDMPKLTREDKQKIMRDFGGSKRVRKSLTDSRYEDLLNIVNIISKYEVINNDTNILYNDAFKSSIYNIFWPLLQVIGFSTENMGDVIDEIVTLFNKFTHPGYFLKDCSFTDNPNYSCGRAMISIDRKPAGFLIFNTASNAEMDPNVINKYYLSFEFEPECKYTINNEEMMNKLNTRIKKELTMLTNIYPDTNFCINNNEVTIIVKSASGNKYSYTINNIKTYPYGPFNPNLTVNDVNINLLKLFGLAAWSPAITLLMIIKKLGREGRQIGGSNNEYTSRYLYLKSKQDYVYLKKLVFVTV